MQTITDAHDSARESHRQRDILNIDLIRSFVTAPRCTDCSVVDPSLFTIAEIHIRMVTMLYPTVWLNMAYLPTVSQTRAYIWQVSGQDTELIGYAKGRVRFKYGMSKLGQRLDWLRVLAEVRDIVNG